MEKLVSQQSKAEHFKALHHRGTILLLPNIWDPLGAALLENLGYTAIATASASVAWTNGYHDGENVPFHEVLARLTRVVNSVALPVTADIESGYAATAAELKENVRQLIKTGIVGINFEDYDKQTGSLFPIDVQCDRIKTIRTIANDMDVPLFINARTDVYLRGNTLSTNHEKLEETLTRGKAYRDAGADGLFPPFMKQKEDLEHVIRAVKIPVNVIAVPGIPALKVLQEIEVARVSLGPGFLKTAIKAMKDLAIKLKKSEGLDEVIHNEVTSEYLKALIKG
jgi:2-methylisocitrate lyase-like PEP mutase family enzyme